MKILVINPGSTSTKIAVYENETPLFISNIRSLFPLTQSLDAEVW